MKRNAFWSLIGIGLAGFVLTVLLYYSTRHWELKALQIHFNDISTERSDLIIDNLKESIETTQSLGDFFAGSQHVDRNEFRLYSQRFLARHKNVYSLEWLPRVKNTEKQEFIDNVRKESLPQFQIKKITPAGDLLPAEGKEEYFPILYTEPFERNKLIMGLDHSSVKNYKLAMEQSIKSGQPIILFPDKLIRLGREPEQKKSFIVFIPHFKPDESIHRDSQTAAQLDGFLSGVFILETIVDESLSKLRPEKIKIVIVAKAENANDDLKYTSLPLNTNNNEKLSGYDSKIKAFSTNFTVGQKNWTIQCFPVSGFAQDYGKYYSTLAFWLGLLLNTLFLIYLYIIFTRNIFAEKQVKKRTHHLSTEIEKRKQAEELIRNSEERLRILFEYSPDPIFIFDLKGTFIDGNEAAEKISGYKREELIGKNFLTLDILSKKGMLKASKQLALLAMGKETTPEEYRLKRKDGSFVTLEISNYPVKVDGKKQVLSTARDITLRKQMEENLRRSHKELEEKVQQRTADLKEALKSLQEADKRFKAFMNFNPEVAFMKDENGRYVYINATFEKVFQCRLNNVIGKTDFALFSADTAKQFEENDHQVLKKDKVIEFIETASTPEGGMRHWLVIKFPVKIAKNKKYLGGVAIDITDKKQLEEMFQQAQKMEAVGRLAGGVAHDFNNQLTVINGYLELIINDLDSRDPMYSKLEEIKKASIRSGQLTKQLLSFSRRQPTEVTLFNINELIDELAKMLHRIIGDDIELSIESSPDKPWNIRGDSAQFGQVITNLVVNARDAMPKGGKITLSTSNISSKDKSGNTVPQKLAGRDCVLLKVRDTGTGITEEVKARMFEPFFTTKEKGKGTGLGLAMCYGIVQQLGGDIQIESQVGKGTTFNIFIPRCTDKAVDKKKETGPKKQLQGSGKILLAEDEEPIRKLITEVLQQNGYQVIQCVNGRKALEYLETHSNEHVDLVISDVVMPEMGGISLIDALEKKRSALKTILVSGHTDDMIINPEALEKNNHFLYKPFTPSQLLIKVQEVLAA